MTQRHGVSDKKVVGDKRRAETTRQKISREKSGLGSGLVLRFCSITAESSEAFST